MRVYHVWNRAARKALLVADQKDLRRLDRLIRGLQHNFDLRLLAYCILDTHFHLLILGMLEEISRAMKSTNHAYALAFNLRHGGSGHVFEGRFRWAEKRSLEKVLDCSRYIHSNALDTGLPPERILEYPWSSLPAYAGCAPADGLDLRLLTEFGTDRKQAQQRYLEYIQEGAPAFIAARRAANSSRMTRREQEAHLRMFIEILNHTRPALPQTAEFQPIEVLPAKSLLLYEACLAGFAPVATVARVLGIGARSAYRTLQRVTPRVQTPPVAAWVQAWLRNALAGPFNGGERK